MKKSIFEDFDGYEDIVSEREHSRKYGIDYSAGSHAVEPFINRYHPERLALRVRDIFEETPSTKTLRMTSKDGYLPPFLAGQYISLQVEVDGIRTSRPYSISSPPNQIGYYDITVRRVQGGLVSNFLLDYVSRGDTLIASGPAGHFHYNPLFHDKEMVCIAGGSGITPFMSMIREVVDRGLDRGIHLFYGMKTLDDAIFHERLGNLASRFEEFHYFPVIEDPPDGYAGRTGLITGDLIRKTVGKTEGKTFYLCGPQGMYDFCISECKKLGVPGRKIRQEVYGAPVHISQSPGWPGDIREEDQFEVNIMGKGIVQARAGTPLMATLEKEGILVPSICRSGECSMCRVKVLSGKVFQPAGALVRKSDRKFGYVHSCVSYPLEDLEILV